jgi:hypothetical protein
MNKELKVLIERIESHIEVLKKIPEEEYEFNLEEIKNNINQLDLKIWNYRIENEFFSNYMTNTKIELERAIHIQLDYYQEYEKIIILNLLMEKLIQINDKDFFDNFFNEDKIRPYWERLEELTNGEKKTPVIKKNEFYQIKAVHHEMLKTTLEIMFDLKKEEFLIENYQKALKIHLICQQTRVNVKEKMKESNIHNIRNVTLQESIVNIFRTWYRENGQTFGSEKHWGHSIYGYFDTLKEYWYLLDENSKNLARSILLPMAEDDLLESNPKDETIYNWIYYKEQLIKFLEE